MEDITHKLPMVQASSNATSQLMREATHGAEPERQASPWLVLRTRCHHENLVASCLNQKRITTYFPKYNVVRRWKDRTVVTEVPLFPGYVFVQPQLEQYEAMRYIPGSCGLVFAGSKPAAMPEKDLEAVRILVCSGTALSPAAKLIPGKRVEVISGPLMGIQGELIRVKNLQRLVINANLLSSSVSVEVDLQSISVL
jgi:transcription antitermination factor NusG